jgi:DNA-binding transcriptional ArsR family regulator
LRVIARLCSEGPLSITQLSEGSKVTRQAISKHLRVLSGAGLTCDRRHGRERIWQLQLARLEAARNYLDQVSANWDAALGRLRAFVEE